MSTRKGDNKKQGQRHQNIRAYKNSLHDTSKRTKIINSLTVGGVCCRCKEIIDWKIKYKKYKPLKVPKKCTVCLQKTIKMAYYIVCQPCAQAKQVCAKCGQQSDITERFSQSDKEREAEEVEFRFMLSQMKEREKRAFLRDQTSSAKKKGKDSAVLPTSDALSSDDNEDGVEEEEEEEVDVEEEDMVSSSSSREDVPDDLHEAEMDSTVVAALSTTTTSNSHALHSTLAPTDNVL